ncbi:hypothetical protein BBJ28_00002437 [Nothophytophthora sp. Chile5]|nr:hypothetical protein BBJ28_00002437 [Nothophytophthora sp. Chile5]
METECKTLWMGDIQMHWDEAFIASLFATASTSLTLSPPPLISGRGDDLRTFMPRADLLTTSLRLCMSEQPVIKLIRDKVTGYPAGYGFLEFPSQRGAQQVLETFNGQLIRTCSFLCSSDDHSIFVGDLAPDVSDELLLSTFSARFTSVRGAKVVMDPVTRMSKGFGFVRFGSKEEADQQALQTMNGVYCSSRPMRVSVATDRNSKARQPVGFGQPAPEEEGTNTTVFVGGLDPSTSEEELRARFGGLGEIVSVKVPPGRGCGFVQYSTKESAEMAIAQMNGTVISGVKVRCAWGRSAAARAANHPANYYQQYGQYQSGYQVRFAVCCG